MVLESLDLVNIFQHKPYPTMINVGRYAAFATQNRTNFASSSSPVPEDISRPLISTFDMQSQGEESGNHRN